MVDFGCDATIDDKQFQKFLHQALVKQAQELLARLRSPIRERSQNLVAAAITNSPEWKSLLEVGSGANISLREHFGLANPEPTLNAIVSSVQEGIVVDLLPPSGEILGGLCVKILPNDYASELKVPGAEYTSEGKRGTFLIPWLKWLLISGAGLILAESQINVSRKSRAGSRTGRAIMVHPTRKPSVGWRVPAEFSGTADNNWLTRSLNDGKVGERIIDEFIKLMETANG